MDEYVNNNNHHAGCRNGHFTGARGEMNRFFDKQGNPITIEEYATLLGRKDYKIIKQTHVGNKYFVSTVWLGMNHAYGDGPPLIFETMVFPCVNEQITDYGEFDMERYTTEKQAIDGHEDMCNKFLHEDQ